MKKELTKFIEETIKEENFDLKRDCDLERISEMVIESWKFKEIAENSLELMRYQISNDTNLMVVYSSKRIKRSVVLNWEFGNPDSAEEFAQCYINYLREIKNLEN